MRVRVIIEGESNAKDGSELAKLRSLIGDQVSHLELSPSVFGVGMRRAELVDVVENPTRLTGYTQSASEPVEDYDLDLDALTVPQLAEMAKERGVDVSRSDGRTDLDPKKADYVAALSA